MYYLVECLIIKNENQYLLEHLYKGVQAGIEHFYIYDNLSEIPVSDFLNQSDFKEKCTIEIWHNTDQNQLDCYSHFLKKHRKDAKWCAFIDTDEMLEGSLLNLCKQSENYLSLKIRQIVHGCNGMVYADYSKTLTERFQSDIAKMQMFKMVVQLEYLNKQYPHHSYIDTEKAKEISIKHWLKVVDWNEQCQLHHYFYKSFEEWLQKVKRGNVYAHNRGWLLKTFFNDNEIPDNERDLLLKKYGLTMDYLMQYGN